MCGIIGYVGSKSCPQLIFDGLKTLEYRGYDSAGIAVLNGGHISIVKSEGKLEKLQPLVGQLPEAATLGLGHTRWATHGPPTTINAHPHVLPDLALVHNGIIENFRDLRSGLEAADVRFRSETDTEVVLHLLSEELKKAPDGREALVSLIPKLKGAFSLGIIIPSDPEAIYLVKQGSPLVIGVGQDGKENLFASDIAALVSHTNKAIVLEDGQLARITSSDIELYSFEGERIEPTIEELDWTGDAVEKAGYAHYMLKEIHEQPAVVASLLQRFLDTHTGKLQVDEFGLDSLDCKKIDKLHVIACGTAYLSGVVAKYALEPVLKLPIEVELASEFRYRDPFVNENTLVVAISQSGETHDTLAAINHAKQKGCQTYSVVNVKHTAIPRATQNALYMECGPEIGVASTKAFLAMVVSQFFFGCALARVRGTQDEEDFSSYLDDFRAMPHLLQGIVAKEEEIKKVATHYYENHNFLFLGRGINYAIAYEGALKLKEISYIHAEGYGAGELKHGPIALVDQHMPILAIASKDQYYDKTISNIEEVRARHGQIIGLGAEGDKQLDAICNHTIACPQVQTPVLQAVLNTVPLQIFAYHIAVLRGTDVDQPRNLAKSVTVE